MKRRRRRGRKLQPLLEVLVGWGWGGYYNLKEQALDRFVWRTPRGCGFLANDYVKDESTLRLSYSS
jgi:hypothetical protein